MTDVYLYSVPSDTNPNDVRLSDPTTAAASTSLALAVTEAPDVAAIAVLGNDQLALAATEAPDTAAITILDANLLALAATESPDVAAISILDAAQLALAATETQDTAAITTATEDPQLLAQVYAGSALWKRKKPKKEEIEEYIEAVVEEAVQVLPQPTPQRVVALVRADPNAAFLLDAKRQADRIERMIRAALQRRLEADNDDEEFLMMIAA